MSYKIKAAWLWSDGNVVDMHFFWFLWLQFAGRKERAESNAVIPSLSTIRRGLIAWVIETLIYAIRWSGFECQHEDLI